LTLYCIYLLSCDTGALQIDDDDVDGFMGQLQGQQHATPREMEHTKDYKQAVR